MHCGMQMALSTAARERIVCVQEDHTGVGEAITTLAGANLAGATAPEVLLSGNDFYSTPRLSPDGNHISWLTWRHPDMPWVTTEAWVGDILPDGTIGNPRRVAGGPIQLSRQAWSVKLTTKTSRKLRGGF